MPEGWSFSGVEFVRATGRNCDGGDETHWQAIAQYAFSFPVEDCRERREGRGGLGGERGGVVVRKVEKSSGQALQRRAAANSAQASPREHRKARQHRRVRQMSTQGGRGAASR